MSFIRDFYSIAVYVLFYLISNTTDTQQLERYVPKFVSVVKMVPEKRGRGKATWRPRSGLGWKAIWRSGGKRGMYVCMS
ncbi:hypothetical protein E4U34_006118 [Claviceps purpurea]|nr:hypothetical protein E4U34_006118 [Claviceps purpurea]